MANGKYGIMVTRSGGAGATGAGAGVYRVELFIVLQLGPSECDAMYDRTGRAQRKFIYQIN